MESKLHLLESDTENKYEIYDKLKMDSNNRSMDHINSNTEENLNLKPRIKDFGKLYQAENYKKNYAYINNLKKLFPYDSIDYKKVNFVGNNLKINNMQNPYEHLEYSPNTCKYNLKRDNFKVHSEQVLKLKYLERGENKKIK
jgi:hypothetical protein